MELKPSIAWSLELSAHGLKASLAGLKTVITVNDTQNQDFSGAILVLDHLRSPTAFTSKRGEVGNHSYLDLVLARYLHDAELR